MSSCQNRRKLEQVKGKGLERSLVLFGKGCFASWHMILSSQLKLENKRSAPFAAEFSLIKGKRRRRGQYLPELFGRTFQNNGGQARETFLACNALSCFRQIVPWLLYESKGLYFHKAWSCSCKLFFLMFRNFDSLAF